MFHVGPISITRELVQRTPRRGSAGGRNSTSQSYFGYWFFLIICFALVGCKTLSLPAINPNGGTIFSGQTTTLVSPHNPANGYPSQGSAYPTPPEPKKCLHGVSSQDGKQGCKLCAGKQADLDESRARCGQLLLTPTKIVAPVGGEVLLLAGICGKDGMLVTGEPIEWMLSPESVGQIIDVGDAGKESKKEQHFWKKASGPTLGKIDVDFARGLTSREAGRITRGTAKTDDDLPIRLGQTWLSLSSPTEGVSKVTVMAPDSEAWDQRRQTATIYWVDASWEFPRVQMAPSGQSIQLVTKVFRSGGFAPADGWIVRYRSLNPDIARFLPQYGEVFEKQVDRNGNAVVDVVNMLQSGIISKPNGSALIEVEVVRPPQGSENMPELPIGRSTVEISWTSPELTLTASGPETAVPGQPLAYAVTLQNDGMAQAENVVLRLMVPNGMEIKSVTPNPTSQTATNLAWDIGVLGPRQALDVQVIVEALAEFDARVAFQVNAAPSIAKEAIVSTLVQKPKLALSINPDPTTTQAGIGEPATFNIKLTNTGNQTVTDLSLLLEASPGLSHIRDGAREVTREVGYLAPGQSVDLSAQFVVEREGDLSVKATALSARQVLSAAQANVRGVAGPQRVPQVDVEMRCSTGANVIAMNTATSVQLIVRNTGPVAIRNLFVSVKYDPALSPSGASAGFEPSYANQLLRWRLVELPAGGSQEFQVNFNGAAPSADAQVVGLVETEDRAVRVMKNVGIPISGGGTAGVGVGAAAIPPSGPSLGGPSNPAVVAPTTVASGLLVAIEPVVNQVRLNQESRYVIRIRNQTDAIQQRVETQIQLPEGVRMMDLRGQAESGYQFDDTGRVIRLDPILSLRAQEELSYTITLMHQLVSEGKMIATVRSANLPDPVSAASTIQTLAP